MVAVFVATGVLLANPDGAFAAPPDANLSPTAIPIELNQGDIFVNAPVGVTRQSNETQSRDLFSPAVGVEIAGGPLPPTIRFQHGPAVGVHVGSGIRAVTPDSLDLGANGKPVEVEGIALAPSTAMTEPPDGISVTVSSISADGTLATLSVDVEPEAEPGLRRLKLFDAEGVAIPPLQPEADLVLLRAPAPEIDSITPSLVRQGDTFELIIRGRNLQGLPAIGTLLADEFPEVLLTPGSDVNVGTAPIVKDDGTVLSVPVEITSAAAAEPRLVQVRTRSATSTDIAGPTNTLRISDQPLRHLRDFVSPAVGVELAHTTTRTRFVHGPAVGVAKGAVITGFDPPRLSQGQSAALTLHGQGLDAVDQVVVSPADGIEIIEGSLQTVNNQVQVELSVAADAPIFDRRVSVTVGTRTIDAPELLQIDQPSPVIDAISPGFLVRDGQSRTFAIQGRNLAQVSSARLLPGDGLILQDFTPLDNRNASLTVLADPAAATGARVLQVMTQTQVSSADPNPFNTLQIVDPGSIARGFTTSLVGVFKPGPDAPEPAQPEFYSGPVGVIMGPVALGVEPAMVEAGRSIRMTVEGRELGDIGEVIVAPGPEIIVENLAVADDGESLQFDLISGAGAGPGNRTVLLQGSNGPVRFAPFESGQFTLTEPGVGVPITSPESYGLPANGTLAVGAADGVLANDTDPNDEPLFAVLTELPTTGSLILAADGGFTYTPDPDFVGRDQFRYAAGNGETVSTSTSVSLEVVELLDAVDDEYSVVDSGVLSVSAADGLLANDATNAIDSFEIIVVDPPVLGELQMGDSGAFDYVPAVAEGTDEFRYRLVSATTRSLPATVRIDIVKINDPPVVSDDHYVLERDEPLAVDAVSGVLANDSDPDGDALAARIVTAPAFGSLALNVDGSFSYQPQAGFAGEDSFVYEASDPDGLTDTGVATLLVNDSLLAVPDAYEVAEDENLVVGAERGLLANDSTDAQGELRIVVDSPPTLGTVEIAGDGGFVYRPEQADVSGTDQFSYFLADDVNTSDPAGVTITITPVNDPPRPIDDFYLTDENVDLVVLAPGVLENDTDPEIQPLTVELVAEPEHGVIDLAEDGSFNYSPEANFRGSAEFTYAAIDDEGASATATVRIDVTQPPTATNDVYFLDQDEVLEIIDPDDGVLVNDHDAPEDDELTGILRDLPLNGSVDFNPDGTFTYVPDAGFVGIDVFTYQVTDGRSESNVATVTLPVGVTGFPRALPDEYAMEENSVLSVNAEQGLLSNDLDADTPPEALSAFLVGTDSRSGQRLDVTVNPDGSFEVRPWGDFSGETFFIYQAFDGTDISNAAVVAIDVAAVNNGVIAEDDSFSVLRNTLFASTVVVNDDYDSAFEVNFEVVTPPAFGSATMNADTGRFQYLPDPDFSGVDTFIYRIFQLETGISDEAEVTLRVNGPPIPGPDFYQIDEDSEISIVSPLANDTDPDGDPLTLVHTGMSAFSRSPRVRAVTLTASDETPSAETRLQSLNHFYGTVAITTGYRVTDGHAETTGTITIEVQPAPDAPIARPDEFLIAKDTSLVINNPDAGVLQNDFDPDFQAQPGGTPWFAAQGVDLEPLEIRLINDVDSGSLSLGTRGTILYTPDPGFSGTDRFVYEIVDATGRTSDSTEAIIVVNSPPEPDDDGYTVNEDTALEVDAAEGLLANDSDADGDPLTASFAHPSGNCGPCNGDVVVRPDGSFTYIPDPDFFGQDAFGYRVRDGVNDQVVAGVTVTVLPVNDTPRTEPDTYRTPEDEVLVVPEPQGVLRNDREVDGDGLANAEVTALPNHGSLEFEPDGRFSYVPDPDFHGTDQFAYRVFDSTGLSSEDQVEIKITSVNDPPVARDDEYGAEQDSRLDIDVEQGVLANDADPDGPELIATMITPPLRGQLVLDRNGSFRYTADDGFSGTDTFTYQVDDGLGAIDSASVAIVISPVEPEVEVQARDDTFVATGAQLEISAPGVLDNDTLRGPGTLEAELVVEPEDGVVELSSDGAFIYRAPAGFEGTDGFTYAARAGDVVDIARVTLNIFAAANNPPLAMGEQYLLLEDEVFESAAIASLLANDTDPEQDPLRVALVEPPLQGELELFADGNFIYTPEPDHFGEDRIIYRVMDGELQSDETTATLAVLAVNDPPVAVDDEYRVPQGEILRIEPDQGLLANDSDVETGELFIEANDPPAHGQITIDLDGSFEYRPDAGFNGTDAFFYVITDLDATDSAEVRIRVESGPNQVPVAEGEHYGVNEDETLTAPAADHPLDNDADPDGDELSVILISVPENGELELTRQTFSYAPDPDYFGTDRFVYRVSDGLDASGEVEAVVEILPVNDPPAATTDLYTTPAGTELVIDSEDGVLQNDLDVEGDPLQASLETVPAHGELDLQATGAFEYRPVPGFTGRDEFAYLADDSEDATVGRVVIDVQAAGNRAPVARGEQHVIPEDSVLDTRELESLLANDTEPDGDPMEIVITAEPGQGSVELLPDGHLRYLPQPDFFGMDRITYIVSDGRLESNPVDAEILILPIPDSPVANPDVYILDPGSADPHMVPAEDGVLANDHDPDGDSPVALLDSPPQFGTVILSLDGGFEYVPDGPREDQDSWRYLAVDPAGLEQAAVVTLIFDQEESAEPIFRDGFEGEPR